MGYSFTYALTTRLFQLGLDSKSLEVRTVIPNDLRVHAEKVSISVYGDLTYLSLNHKTGKKGRPAKYGETLMSRTFTSNTSIKLRTIKE